MTDMVNHPPHYNGHPAGIEAIEVLRHATDYNLGTAMKYIWRVMWGGKGLDVEDISKAIWYLEDWKLKQSNAQPPRPVHGLLEDDPYEERELLRRAIKGFR